MKRYTKIYFEHHGYTTADFIPCRACGKRAVDVHHIEARGIGGSKERDTPENLIALCRECHIRFGDKKQYIDYLKNINK